MLDLIERWDGGVMGWLLFVGFWLVLTAVAVAETLRPIHLDPREQHGRLAVNFGMGIVNALLFAALPLSAIAAGAWASAEGIGLLNLLPVPDVAGFVLTITAWSLIAYALHRIAHRLPWLWRLHRVHHADTAVDLSTGFRNHPLETLVMAAARGAAAVAMGASVAALVAYETAALLFAIWTHANLRLPDGADRSLRLLVVTPAMHHVHHSADQDQTDSNYGDVFSLWDRLFGTYRRSDNRTLRTIRFGLGAEHDEGSSNLLRQLAGPLAR